MKSARDAAGEWGAAGGGEPATRRDGTGGDPGVHVAPVASARRTGAVFARALGATARSPRLVLLVLLVSVAVLFAPSIGGASTTEIDGCTTIKDSGEYELIEDLEPESGACIELDADHVVIDGNGHTIDGQGSAAIKRTGDDEANVTVRNVTIENADTGLDFDYIDGVTVENVTIRNGENQGVSLYAATDVSIRNVTLRGNDGLEVKADDSTTTVTGTDVTIGDPDGLGTEMDFYGSNFNLDEVTDPPEDPVDNVSLQRYFELGYVGGSFDATIPYRESEVHGIDLDTLSVFEYHGGWQRLDSSVDADDMTISTTEPSRSNTYGVFGEEGPYFDVTVDSRNASIVEGETVHVEATVNNTGRVDGSETISLTTNGEERLTQTVDLAAGDETTVEFQWNTSDGDAGVYDAAVESEHDADSWSLHVADPDGPIWETDADWSGGEHVRTVSDGAGDRENDTLRLGYPASESGLVGYWPFDSADGDTAVDAAGDNDGTHEGNGAIGTQPGLLNGNGYEFDGDSRIDVAEDPSLRLQDELAISLWVNTTELGHSDKPDGQTFLLDRGTSEDHGYELLDDGTNGDELLFRVHGNSQQWDAAVPRDAVNDGNWHHLVAVRDGQTIRLYLDGALVGDASRVSAQSGSQNLTIGSSDDDQGHYEGAMDELRIYDRALSDDEIVSLYETRRDGTHATRWRPLTEPIDTTGLQLDATATVPDGSATVYVETDADHDGVADDVSEPIELTSGTTQYGIANLSGQADTVRLRTELETTDLYQTPIVDRAALEEPADFRVNVTGTNRTAVAGEAVAVDATVENVGDLEGTQNVSLSIDDVAGLQDETELTLGPGEASDVSLVWQTGGDDDGNHTATVASEDANDSTTVTVDQPATFEVHSPLDTNSPVVENDTLWVNATVENVGDREGAQDVTLTLDDGDTTNEVGNETETIAAGSTKEVSFEWTTGVDDANEYRAAVASDDDVENASVMVFAPDDFQVEIDDTNSPIEPGDDLLVNATVENLGGENATQTVALAIDDGDPVDETNVTLDGHESQAVNLTWNTTVDDVGDHTATVSSEDGSDDAAVHVLEPANFTVEAADPQPVLTGDPVEVAANVTNVGEVNATTQVNLSVAGEEEDATTVTVNASESKDVTLTWQTDDEDVGAHDATVATENDSDELTVQVDAPANVTVDVLDDEPSVVAGERLDLVANVTNVGDREATRNVTLVVDGGGTVDWSNVTVDWTNVTVDGRTSRNVTLSWTPDADAHGDYDATVDGEDDAETVPVRVHAPANFTVDVTGYDETVEAGETVSITANVTNGGDVGATKDMKLSIDGQVEDLEAVTLAADESRDVTFAWDTADDDVGNHSLKVSSEDDEAEFLVTVEEPSSGGGIPVPPEEPVGPRFTVDVLETNSPVTVGETAQVRASVTNVGDENGSERVVLRRGETTLDTASVPLGANESATVVFEWTPTADDVGANMLVVEGSSSSEVRYVRVEEPDAVDAAPVDVAIEETNAPLDAGRALRVTASVTANADVETAVELLDFGGDRVASRELALERGESATVTLTWRTASADAGRDRVTVRSEGASDARRVQLREPAAFVGTIESVNSPVTVTDTLAVEAVVESEADRERTSDVVLEIDGVERDVRTLTLAPGESERVTLEWPTTAADRGDHALALRAGSHLTTRDVTVENASSAGPFGGYAPKWAGTAVDYAPTTQDTHVGGFLWLTALIALVGGYLLATRVTADARLLGATLLVAAVRTSTDVLHAAVEALTLEPLLALNASLELAVGLCFLAFAAAYAEYDGVLERRGAAALLATAVAGTAVAATNPAHGLVFTDVTLVDGPFTYVAAEQGPLGWLLLSATLGSLLLAVALLGQSFLAGTDPAWRPVGVLGAGLCLAVVFVGMSVLERGPLPQYDYTGAGVGAFLLVATTAAVGHGLHRITHDAQRSLLEDLEDPIVIVNDAHVVVEFNAAAADLLPRVDPDEPFESLVGYDPEWPAPGETTTVELSLEGILPAETDGGTTNRPTAEQPADRSAGDAASNQSTADAASNQSTADATSDQSTPDATSDQTTVDTASDQTTADGARAPTTENRERPSARTDRSPTDGTSPEPGVDDRDATDEDGPQSDRPDEGAAPAPAVGESESPRDHYLVQTTSVTADTGDTLGYTIRFTDVSELKRRTEELTRKNAQLEQVASTMSHDLRNPLTVADGYLEIAAETVRSAADDEVRPSAIADHLEPIRESLRRMDAIIEDILALARSSDPVTDTEPVAFGDVVEDAWATVDTGAATLFVEADGAIDADRLRLQRVLENLFRNAVEHVGDDVAVLVGLTEDGFYVADDGPGVPEGHAEDVFEQGYTDSPEGTGLGLSIVAQLARAHGWTVRVDDEYDSGARFVFEGCDTEVGDPGAE